MGTNNPQTRAVKDAPLGWKWCSCCGEVKKLDQFDSNGKGTGRYRRPQSQCKVCRYTIRRRQT